MLAFSAVAIAQNRDAGPRLAGSAGNAGISHYRNDRWGIVQTQVANPTDTEQRVRVLFRFDDQPAHQFSRAIVIPPRTTRQEQFGVRLSGAPADARSAANETILLHADDETEISRQVGTVLVSHDPNLFVVINEDSAADDEAAKALEAVREAASLQKAMAYCPVHNLMQFEVGWDGVRFAVMLADNVPLDGAQSRALRRWLYGGGTLIVFADQVEDDAMHRVLGDDWGVSYIDRITLTSLPFLGRDGEEVAAVTTENPIVMTRVAAPQYTSVLSVAGWPALMTRDLGHGRIVLLTVGGRAWSEVGGEGARDALAKLLLPPALTMNFSGMTDSATAITDHNALVFVSDQIGVRVLGRGAVGGVLLALAVFLGGAGWFVVRRGRGEWLGVIGLAAAIVATAVLIVAGSAARGQEEPTAASLDLVRVIPGQSVVRVDAVTGIFHPRDTRTSLSGQDGGWAWPTATETAGKTFRMQWSDLDAWSWPGVEVPEHTVKTVRVQLPAELRRPLSLRLRYTADGLAGTIDRGDVPPLTDAVVAGGSGRLGVRIREADGRTELRIDAADVLAPGVYFGGDVLSAVQQDRKRVLDHLFSRTYYDRPTLLAWAESAPAKLGIEPELARRSNALYEMPLRVEKASPGDKVRIPSPLIAMTPRGVGDERYGLRTMILYRDYERSWIEISQPSAFIADFRVPDEVLPLRIDSAVIHLDIKALGRSVRVLSVIDGAVHEIATHQSPDGRLVIQAGPDDLRVDAAGRVRLAFDVGPLADDAGIAGSNLWGARHFGLEITGTVLEEPTTTGGP